MSAALWQSVLLQTVEDALYGVAGYPGNHRRHIRVLLISEARSYLTTPSADLSTVCALAGMDMRAVIKRMRDQIVNAASVEELADRKGRTWGRKDRKILRTQTLPTAHQVYTLDGATLPVETWAARAGVSVYTINDRVKRGMDLRDALTMSASEAIRSARKNTQAAVDAERSWSRGSPAKMLTLDGITLTIR